MRVALRMHARSPLGKSAPRAAVATHAQSCATRSLLLSRGDKQENRIRNQSASAGAGQRRPCAHTCRASTALAAYTRDSCVGGCASTRGSIFPCLRPEAAVRLCLICKWCGLMDVWVGCTYSWLCCAFAGVTPGIESSRADLRR